MKKYLFLAVLMLIGAANMSAASPKKKAKVTPEMKGVASINRSTAEAHVGFLACDELEGREAGWKGGRIAGNYIISCLKQMGLQPLFEDGYVQPFEAYHAERQKRGQRWQVHPDSIAKLKTGVHQKLDMRNILAKIEGKNPNEIVIIGAHYDHLGYDPMLNGDQIYNGADDNASGVQAVLQVARAFLATGEQPERTV
ncbi:MAG: M28 family peptidase, partial [Bacteroides sp.]|nr:M28 family peptidase [Bacteroides sp.]